MRDFEDTPEPYSKRTTSSKRGDIPTTTVKNSKSRRDRHGGEILSESIDVLSENHGGEQERTLSHDDYEEDFEDYEEDFEDFEDFQDEERPKPSQPEGVVKNLLILREKSLVEISEVQKALQAENQRASSRQEQRAKYEEEQFTKRERTGSALPQRKRVGLENALKQAQRAKTLSHAERRQAKRAKDLSNMVTLDVCFYDVFDLHPMNEYELYIRNFGSSNAVQAATQSNEDRTDQDMQTDVWPTDVKWVQCPPDQFTDSGSGNPLTHSTGHLRSNSKILDVVAKVDSVRLSNFLQRSSQVMDILLEESTAAMGISSGFAEQSSLNISQGVTTLQQQKNLSGRQIRDVCYSTTDYRLLLVAYSMASGEQEKDILGDKGILCLWQLSDPTVPYRVLVCEGDPTCCCFAPTKPYLVFAGTGDGSVLAWNLQESPSLHRKVIIDGQEILLRYPSYSTSGIYTLKGTHDEPIRNIMALHQYRPAREDNWHAALGVSSELEGQSFQVASLDESGWMHIWAVVELRSESITASELDFGMAIGGRLKLIRSTGFKISLPRSQTRSAVTDLRVLDCKFRTNDIDRFIVGTDIGTIIHESRFRNRCNPRTYNLKETTIAQIDGVSSLDFCPHDPRLFLAGYTSGMVGMFAANEATAIMRWTVSKGPVRLVRWSPHRPAVFYVLDETGTLHVWDLSESEAQATQVVKATKTGDNGRIVTFALSPTIVSAASTVSHANLAAASGRNATIMLGYADGTMEVHLLDSTLAERAIDEEHVLASYVGGTRVSQNAGKEDEEMYENDHDSVYDA
ncbi:uncharacterized protein SPPG_02357 [Spizellomyces punctatus DAOM BR117]|uniref:Uncharacterized protein n=2 Tax=Spizellomyces punctatus (strain DAOM BR117) TaxID=645134 RepID=A0A0L0HQT8_SPIPD|nr:uncharacterized protein SPPG_02357 [Spizellomyces punctatus DAOM BR117]KND03310.1 hypothetical protein SPPG_02357 [Spizellomyces punctatus DAOM BR117]|eukprot:XP_016611349.1 hypothetical protein SPPG_02357 [Spizellomyces punctatus DAOM BR117]